MHLSHGKDSLSRACDRVRPVGVIGPADALPADRVISLSANGTRAVLAIAQQPLDYVATIVYDQGLVGETAVAHLIERGHRNIVAVMPSEGDLASIGPTGYAALRPSERTRCDAPAGHGQRRSRGHRHALAPVLATNPTALYAFNDEYAFFAIEALEATGHEVPATSP